MNRSFFNRRASVVQTIRVTKSSLRPILFFSLFTLHSSLFTEVAAQLNTWQLHPSYQSGRAVAVAKQTVFAASKTGLFWLDESAGQPTPLTKQNGLTDAGVSRMQYLPDQNRLLIAYNSGALDLLGLSATGQPTDNVLTINTIRDATQLSGSRRTNHISRAGTDVYLSTDFGIAVLNLTRNEIRDTYRNIGPGGVAVRVLATATANDSLFALTDLGLLAGRLTTNLAFFGSWRVVTGPLGRTPDDLLTANGQLLATVGGRGVFGRQSGSWVSTLAFAADPLRLIPTPTGTGFGLLARNVAVLPNSSRPTPVGVNSPRLLDPRDAALTADGTQLWVADAVSGLFRLPTAGPPPPDGPASDQFAALVALPGGIAALPGGTGFDLFGTTTNRWQSFPTIPTNFGAAVFDRQQSVLYTAGNSNGLWQTSFNATGQTGPPTPVLLPATVPATISSLAIDANNNLWITTPQARFGTGPAALHVRLATSGQFQSYTTDRRDLLEVLIDDNGFLWLRLSPVYGGGLLVYDPNTNRSRFLSNVPNEGNLPGATVLSMVKDRNGAIWVGTSAGVTVFDNPAGVFAGNVNAFAPVFERRALLRTESITALAVDGGNRKWIGTSAGLYRFSPDGTQLLANFTTANSPLPANEIEAIAIDPTTGTVMVSTPSGLASYRGPATDPADALTGITIFPNPVRPDFTGTVGIRGLTNGAVVKILDAGGQLVYETRAEGGTATWNLSDYRGRNAQTGIYLVIVIAADGSEGLAGKLAVVR
jgi:hypothetical protein